MKARILVGTHAYAVITDDAGVSIDIRLSPGKSAVKSLRESAAEYLERARRLERMATVANDAADILEKGN